MLFNPLVPACF